MNIRDKPPSRGQGAGRGRIRRPPSRRARVRSGRARRAAAEQADRPRDAAEAQLSGRLLALPSQQAALAQLQGQPAAATGASGSSSSLFIFSLFAEFVANDKPIVAYYKGELLFPVLVDYPESKFGGFLAVTDYKDPVILEEIEKNGWAIWPPISYSYHSINKDYPRIKNASGQCLGFPGPPPWSTSAAFCDAPADQHGALHVDRQPQLARHRRPGPRCAGAPDLRLPHLRAVRAAADDPVLHRRRHRRRRRRAISAAASTSSSSASWRSGRRSPRCSC